MVHLNNITKPDVTSKIIFLFSDEKAEAEHEPRVTQHAGNRMKTSIQASLVFITRCSLTVIQGGNKQKQPRIQECWWGFGSAHFNTSTMHFCMVGLSSSICEDLGSFDQWNNPWQSSRRVRRMVRPRSMPHVLPWARTRSPSLPRARRKPQKKMLRWKKNTLKTNTKENSTIYSKLSRDFCKTY